LSIASVDAAGVRKKYISPLISRDSAEVHEMQGKDVKDSVTFDEGQRFAEMGNWDSIHELDAKC
jgi:hypothetical protein